MTELLGYLAVPHPRAFATDLPVEIMLLLLLLLVQLLTSGRRLQTVQKAAKTHLFD